MPDPSEVADLRRSLHTLVHQLVNEEPEEASDDQVGNAIREHLGTEDLLELPILTEPLENWDLPNLQLAIDDLLGPISDSHAIIGLPADVRHYGDMSIPLLLHERFKAAPLQYTNVPVGPGRLLPCLDLALHLTTVDARPIVVFTFVGEEHGPGGGGLTVQVLSTHVPTATSFLAELRRAITAHDVYRGQVISVETDRHGSSKVVFQERSQLPPESLVLPDGVLDRVQRHIVGPTEHRELLLAQGHHLSRGLLLWGPPGTGKTHTVRYLTGQLTDATIIVLSAGSLGMVGGFATLARRLEPSVVVLEDVDLVAGHRTMDPYGGGGPILFELMDQMSGHAGDADIAFVLTTNMPEALEAALAARPGRVDLAVEIPLPDAPSRRKLFDLYAGEAIGRLQRVDEFVERTDGVTASFVRELMRKSALVAAMAGEDVSDAHVETALTELLSQTSALTRTLLGVGGPSQAAQQASQSYGHGMGATMMGFLEEFPDDVDYESMS